MKYKKISRGTVRDPQKKEGFQHLINIANEICGEKAEERLKFYAADLLKEGSFDECTEGAHTVMHVASNVVLNVNDPENELIKPAVEV
jgi:bifunctional dihydroflavonol 4-reductase/flavanone 4-reductase